MHLTSTSGDGFHCSERSIAQSMHSVSQRLFSSCFRSRKPGWHGSSSKELTIEGLQVQSYCAVSNWFGPSESPRSEIPWSTNVLQYHSVSMSYVRPK